MACKQVSLKARRVVVAVVVMLAFLPGVAWTQIVATSGVSGRFIKITNLNPLSRSLAIGEIEGFNFGVVPSSPSALSGNDINGTFEAEGVASGGFTVDHGLNTATTNNFLDVAGNTYNRTGVGVFHTIDLGSTQNIGAIRVWQRADGCCQDRLTDFKVEVLADSGGLPGASLFTKEYAQPPTNSFGQIDVVGARELRPGGLGVVGTDTQGSAGGRFISVKNNGSANRFLAMGEIEAFLAGVTPGASYDPANNVAMGTKGTTWQSEAGAYQHGLTGYVLNGAATGGAESWNRLGVGAELVIDLGQQRNLGTIRVWQRGDGCCQDRLQDFSVSLLDDNGSGLPGAVLNTQSFSGQPATNSFASFSLPAFTNTPLFTIESTDALIIDIDPGANTADLLKIGTLGNGALTIQPGADLILNFLNDDFPSNQLQTYNILDFATVSGSFGGNITFNNLPSNVIVDLSNLYTTGQFTAFATPEPYSLAAWLFAGLAGVCCGNYFRRRVRT